MEPVRLRGLRPQSYEHPSDKQALDVLKYSRGFDLLVRKLNEISLERLLRVEMTGSSLKVTPDSFPALHGLLTTACERIDLPTVPELYIAEGDLNALTLGVEHPMIVVNRGAIDHLSEEELLFVIGHEAGHVKSGHVLYYQIAELAPVLGGIIGTMTFGIGELLSAGLQVALMQWKRTAELTADRAGLLACQDADAAFRALMKLAGLPHKYYSSANTEDFLAQARAFKAMDSDKLNLIAKALSIMRATHPWTVMRAQNLLVWIESGEYDGVLAMYANAGPDEAARFCRFCGLALPPGAGFCRRCGRAANGGSAAAAS